MKKMKSFSGRLTRSVVLTVLAVMTFISMLVFLVTAAGLLLFTRAHVFDLLDKTQGNMASTMSRVEVSADNIIDELSWHLDTPDLVISTIQYELKTNRHLYGCAMGFVPDYYRKQGRWFEPYALNGPDGITVRNIGSQTHDYFSAEWYTMGLESPEGVWSNPYIDDVGAGTVLCTYSRQVTDPKGKVAGVFGADLSLNALSEFVSESIRKENESPIQGITPDRGKAMIYGFIIGRDGDYIVHPDTERVLKTNFYDFASGEDVVEYKALGDAMRAGESGEMSVEIDGVKSHVYYAPLLNSGWSMGIVVPTKRLLFPGLLFGSIIIFLILLGLVIVFVVCYLSIRHATKPLIRLVDSAKEVALGNFDTELPTIRRNDEIRLLRDSFDNMQKSLKEYIAELTETTMQKASMERELDVARKIQMSMLPVTWPAFPERDDIDIYASVAPAKAVGGDLYDFRLRDGKLFFCIGDVSGKGIPASLVMTEISSMFRTLSATEDNPAKVLSSINASMSARNDSLMFVTLFVGVLDLASGELRYSNAGHNAPVVITEGTPKMLKVDCNVAVGIEPDWEFSLQTLMLPPASMLFLYTDGLTEATRAGDELFGEKRVLDALAASAGKGVSAEQLITQMSAAVDAFVGDAEQSDDLTMLALRILPGRKSAKK